MVGIWFARLLLRVYGLLSCVWIYVAGLVIGCLLWLFGVLSVCVLVFWLGLLCAVGLCFALSCGLWLSCLYSSFGVGFVRCMLS